MKIARGFILGVSLFLSGTNAFASHNFGHRIRDTLRRVIFDSNRGDYVPSSYYEVRCRHEGNRIVLDYFGGYFDSNGTSLSRAVEYNCGIPTNNLSLYSITLMAKSRLGLSYVAVGAGDYQSPFARVHGNPVDFGGFYGYKSLDFYLPPAESQGPWYLQFRGEARVGQIYLNLSADGRNR